MKEFIAIATVHYYNDVTNTSDEEYIVLTEVDTFAEAARRIEEYYGLDLESINVTLLDGPFLTLTQDSVDNLMKGTL